MKHLSLPKGRRLCFYLAAEEWVAQTLLDRDPREEYFFTWRVAPTVIYGRHQDPEVELNFEYCLANGIDTIRRKSGGGCVYADMDNIMFSYITAHAQDIPGQFSAYTESVAAMLRTLGLNATAGGRNDVLVDGAKVSGNSFYRSRNRSIIHGTMLYDTNFENMARAITPARAKLESKKVKSVNSRITTLAQRLNMDIAEFEAYAVRMLSGGEQHTPTPAEIAEIERIERPYILEAEATRSRQRQRPTATGTARYLPQVGMVTPYVGRDAEGNVTSLTLTGDFFTLSDDPGAELLECLRTGGDPGRVIPNLTFEQLKELVDN